MCVKFKLLLSTQVHMCHFSMDSTVVNAWETGKELNGGRRRRTRNKEVKKRETRCVLFEQRNKKKYDFRTRYILFCSLRKRKGNKKASKRQPRQHVSSSPRTPEANISTHSCLASTKNVLTTQIRWKVININTKTSTLPYCEKKNLLDHLNTTHTSWFVQNWHRYTATKNVSTIDQ